MKEKEISRASAEDGKHEEPKDSDLEFADCKLKKKRGRPRKSIQIEEKTYDVSRFISSED